MNRHWRHLDEGTTSGESIVTIGVFDGVHRGHQRLIDQMVRRARITAQLAVVVTFHPHPDKLLQNAPKRYYLTSPESRAEVLLELGVDLVVTHPFDEETRRQSAQQFVDQLVTSLKIKELWVGADFALGYDREGTADYLRAQGKVHGFTVTVFNKIVDEACDEIISSCKIRQLLGRGDVSKAKAMLGRSYSVSGEVVAGEQRGRSIGVPTANLEIWDEAIIPANGVYAGWALLNSERFMAATNIGIRPTFGEARLAVEAHLLDFEGDIYGERLELTFEKRLRPERKFESPADLVEQIRRDISAARDFLRAQ